MMGKGKQSHFTENCSYSVKKQPGKAVPPGFQRRINFKIRRDRNEIIEAED